MGIGHDAHSGNILEVLQLFSIFSYIIFYIDIEGA